MNEYGRITETLYTLARIYDIGSQFLAPPKRSRLREIEYGARMWVDQNIVGLGWALLASVFALVLYIAWLAVR